MRVEDGVLRARGTQIGVDPEPYDLRYRLETEAGFVTRVPPEAARRHRVAVVVRRAEHESPVGVARAAGGQTVPGARPRLLRHFRWIDVYEVRLAG